MDEGATTLSTVTAVSEHASALAHLWAGSTGDCVADSTPGRRRHSTEIHVPQYYACDNIAEECASVSPLPQSSGARNDHSVAEPVLLSNRRVADCRNCSFSADSGIKQVASNSFLGQDLPVVRHASSCSQSANEYASDADLREMPPRALCAKMHLIRHISQLAPLHAKLSDDGHSEGAVTVTYEGERSNSFSGCLQDRQCMAAKQSFDSVVSNALCSELSPSLATKSRLRPENDVLVAEAPNLVTASCGGEAYAIPRACEVSNHAFGICTHRRKSFEIQQKERLRLEARDQAVVLTKMKRALHAFHLSFARVTSDVLLAGWDAQLDFEFASFCDEINKLRRYGSVRNATDANVGVVAMDAMDIDPSE